MGPFPRAPGQAAGTRGGGGGGARLRELGASGQRLGPTLPKEGEQMESRGPRPRPPGRTTARRLARLSPHRGSLC